MAGCGNSRMTEEMFEDGEFLYRLFFATDFFLPRPFNPSYAPSVVVMVLIRVYINYKH